MTPSIREQAVWAVEALIRHPAPGLDNRILDRQNATLREAAAAIRALPPVADSGEADEPSRVAADIFHFEPLRKKLTEAEQVELHGYVQELVAEAIRATPPSASSGTVGEPSCAHTRRIANGDRIWCEDCGQRLDDAPPVGEPDELAMRLRDWPGDGQAIREEAADRIEQLKAELRDARLSRAVSGAALAGVEQRAKAAERQLAEARKALERIEHLDEAMGHELRERHAFEAVAIARAALASLTTSTKGETRTWRFHRYVNGQLMAEGVKVRAKTETEALAEAARLFDDDSPESTFKLDWVKP
jgi:hypothetical protein